MIAVGAAIQCSKALGSFAVGVLLSHLQTKPGGVHCTGRASQISLVHCSSGQLSLLLNLVAMQCIVKGHAYTCYPVLLTWASLMPVQQDAGQTCCLQGFPSCAELQRRISAPAHRWTCGPEQLGAPQACACA